MAVLSAPHSEAEGARNESGAPAPGGATDPRGLSVLTVNPGSTGLKLNLVLPDERTIDVREVEDLPSARVVAVGYRVVHGGERFREPVLITPDVLSDIRELEALAPLHNAPALEAIEDFRGTFPGVPHVAVFDTGFHSTLPPEAFEYALPRRWREQYGIRKFGFHGISMEWSVGRSAEILGVDVPKMVVCHLGGGCSVTGVLDGRSVDTTMGFTPMEGVPMVSRSGSIDPGIVFHLLRRRLMEPDEIEHALEYESGLKGMGGCRGDMWELERAVDAGDEHAQRALDVFVHRVSGAVATMAVAVGGLGALIFTGGIGEHSAVVRERVCRRLEFLGVEIDPAANAAAPSDTDIGTPRSCAHVLVIRAREELIMARAVRSLMCLSRGG